MASELNEATDIPVNRTDALHILALNGDDLKHLSFEQKTAILKIYFLDDDRTVEQLVQAGEITISKRDIQEIETGDPL
ncbi:hypothetical protein [Methanoregula sp.]|jgi:hypothetical protein|uniref:hypothetical protein n=1 Tax=Methanoregula sp. TaxID=2052170 RepID=UPI003C248613